MIIQFGSPIGGIMFAIEISTSSFQVKNLNKFFVGACFGALIVRYIHNLIGMKTIVEISINEVIDFDEILLFALLGICIGIVVSLYLAIFNRYFLFRQQTKYILFKNRYLYVSLVSLLITIFSFYHEAFQEGYKSMMLQLIKHGQSNDPDSSFIFFNTRRTHIKSWMTELFLIFVIKHIMVLGFSTCSIPNGVMTPTIVLGLLFGRFYGEIMKYFHIQSVNPRLFALAGASAYLSAITKVSSFMNSINFKSFSGFLIILEISNNMHYLLPFLVSCVCAVSIVNIFQPSIFELVIFLRQLHFMPNIVTQAKIKFNQKKFKRIMRICPPERCLTINRLI
jgi:H+/Cl- antiporter ClcA